MKYFAVALRVLIILVWFKMMYLWNWEPNTVPFCSWIGFIVVWVYFTLLAVVWPKALLCPFKKCDWKKCEK
jgi:hypothetical protein